MKILHYYDDKNDMIAQYVRALCDGMGLEVTNDISTSLSDAVQKLNERHYDLLNVHGCWSYSAYRAVRQAFRANTRLVLTPHGQLEPWIISRQYWTEKLPKKLLFQQRMVQSAYAVIIQGHMEEECMKKLGWNSRTVIIRNSLITQTTTAKAMSNRTFHLYRKIMDSNPWALMTDDTKSSLRQMLKVGITGDIRWLQDTFTTISDADQWRMLYCYIHQEQISKTVQRAIPLLNLNIPDFDISSMPCFMPDGYEPSKTIEEAIGMQFATENDRLLATFRHLKHLTLRSRLTLSHLVELDKELRTHGSAEDQLCNTLREKNLFKFAARIMQLMNDFTGLDEGLMLMAPIDDRLTGYLRRMIENHLRI